MRCERLVEMNGRWMYNGCIMKSFKNNDRLTDQKISKTPK